METVADSVRTLRNTPVQLGESNFATDTRHKWLAPILTASIVVLDGACDLSSLYQQPLFKGINPKELDTFLNSLTHSPNA